MENLVLLGHLEFPVIQEDLESLGKRDLQGHPALKEDLVYQDHLDYLDFPVREAYLDFQECLD